MPVLVTPIHAALHALTAELLMVTASVVLTAIYLETAAQIPTAPRVSPNTASPFIAWKSNFVSAI